MTAPNTAHCELCGKIMPVGEEMFRYHGFSGPCPKPEPFSHILQRQLKTERIQRNLRITSQDGKSP